MFEWLTELFWELAWEPLFFNSGRFPFRKKNQEISVGAKVDSPIGKKLFHLVVNPGVVPVTRRDTKMAAELVIILQILD